MTKLTAQQLYDNLKDKANIIGKSGKINFSLLGVAIHVKTRNVVGDILQSWLEEWFIKNSIDYEIKENSQDWPDFYLNPDNKNASILEVKSFDRDRSPNFDIANFDAYINSLTTDAYRLDADYLIFGYKMDDNCNVIVTDLWLKKIWEICGPSQRYNIKTQVKKDIIYNIRPVTWYSEKAKYRAFKDKKKFLEAIEDTMKNYKVRKNQAKEWIGKVNENYIIHGGKSIY